MLLVTGLVLLFVLPSPWNVVALLVGLVLFLRRTTIGVQMRAAAEDFGVARLLGVRANVVAPGYVNTRLTDVLPDDAKQAMLANTPLGRLGDPEDVAGAVRFLCSDDASFITGEVLLVDGGLGM